MKTPKQSLFLGICMLWYCLPALSQNASNPYPNTMLANVFTQNIATGISVPGGDGFTNAGISTTTLANNNFLSLTVGSNSPVCSGNSLNLTSTPSGGTAPYTYKWTGPNGFSSTQQNPTITNVTTAASGTYSLEVEDGLDNSSNASISVTVNPTPTVASISGNSTGCVGSTITLSDATPGGVWSSSNTTVATVSNAGSVSVKALGSTIISYTVTTVAGCSATVTKTISTASVVLHPDLIECNNGIASFNATDTYYGVTYSNSNAGNSFFWAITGGSFSYQGSSTASSQYPRVQLLTGSSFQVVVQFTTNDITCVDTQIVYKNSIAADTIQGSHDTTVCYNTAPINLLGKVSLVTNLYNWSTSGAGTFSNPNALNTTYTPSGADKTIGVIKIYLQGSSTINSTGNCGTSTSMDSMTLRIAPDNTGTNSVQTICSNQSLNFTPVSTISGSTYSWASSVTAGSLTGNTASGTGNIIDSLVNLSSTGDAVVIYTIIPYSFTPTNNTCTGTPFTFTVTAKPKPAVTITNNATAICTGSNTNIQFSSSLTGSVYTWSSSVISGTASGNSSVAVATTTNQINDVLINNSTANATVRYHITAFSPSGCSNTDSTDVVIYALPTVANAGPDQALCDTTTAILAGNNPVSGTGNWAFLSGPSAVTFGAPSSPSGSVNGLIPGTYQLTWTISNGSCAVSKDTVVIINSAQSVAGSISANATVCAGNNNGTLTLSGYTGNIIRWESSTDGGTTWPTVINNTTSTYTYSNLTATTLFRAVVQNGACSFAYVNPVTITVNPISAPGTLTSDAIVCAGSNNSTLTLSGYTGNIIRWESSSDNGITWTNIANTTNTLTYTNLTITTLYRSLVQSGVCSSAYSNAVTITVNPQTIAGSLAADATVCATANSGTLSLSAYTGNIIRWESSSDNGTTWTNIANTTNTLTYNNLAITTLYRLLVQSGMCTSIYSNNATITVIQPVTIANAGPDQTLCYTTSASLSANTPASGTGTWTALTGNPSTVTFTNAADPATTINGLTTGTYLFVWTISNSACADSKDTVQITVNPQTVPGSIAASATVCATSNNGTLTLSGYTGSIISWESSIDNGTTWINIANTGNALTYNNLNASTQYRAYVQSGVCPPLYSSIATITVIQAVTTANAGSDQTLCYTTSASLAANTPVSGTGTWTALTGNSSTVTFTNAADPATTINGLTTGTYLFVWTISNNTCADSKDTVQLTINPQTVPGTIATSATVCATANNGTLTLSGYTGSIIRWESSIDNGTTWINIANTGNTLTYNNLATSTQYRAYVQSGVCPPLYSSIATITVIQPVTTANAGSDQTLCYTTSASLAANTPASGTGTWTALTGNPSTVTFTNAADPATTINGLTTGTYLFVWTISNSTCADSKDTVQLTINPQTVPGTIAASATVCATSNNGTLTLSGYTGSIIRWESSIDNGTTWINIANTGNTLTYNNLNTSTQYRAYVQSGVCPPLYSSIATITVIQAVTIANAGPDQTLCYTTSASLAANTPVSGTGTWTALTGNSSTVTFTNAADPATTINGLTTGTYLFVWTISNSTCADSKDTVQLTINPQTVPGSIAASATVCATANNGTLTLSGYTGSILHWESSINNGTTWNNIVNTGNTLTYNNLATSTQYRAYVQSGVCPPLYSSIATITVIQAVTIANAGPDQSLCNVASATLAANTPTSGTGTWTAFAGNPSTVSFTNIASPATTVNGLTAGTYQFLWTISNGTCSDSKDTIQITVNPATNPGTLAADATVCATSNNGTLTLSNYLSSILRWESSVDNGSSWTNVANTSNTLAYNNLSATTKYRAYVQNAVCPSLYSNIVTITVLQPVTTANAGPDTTVINGITSYKLGANTPTSGTGTWSVLPGGPSTLSFVNPSDPNTTVGGLAFNPGTPPTNGNYKLVWTVSNGYCAISRDTMQITVQPPTNPGVIGPDAVVCTSNNHGTLVLSDYLGTVLQWESSIDYGATWSVIVSTVGTNQATYTYDNLTTTTLFRALVKNGVGAELYSGIAATVTVLQLVTPADAGPDQTLCNTTSTSLAANTPVSGVGIWSALAGNPSSVTFSNSADRKSVVNGLTIGTYRFVWTISNGICSDSRDTVNITIQLPTIAGTIEADATVCITSNTGTLSISGFRGSILQGEVSIDNGSSWLAIANTANLTSYIYNNLATTSQFRAKVQNGVCPALFTNIVTITVLQEATIANAGTDQSLCNVTATTLAANTPASGTGIWTALAGNPSTTTFTNPNNPTTTVNALTAGTYQFIWTISNALCADSKDTVRITVYSPSVAGTLAAAATVCANVNTGTLTLSGYVSSIIRWESSSNNGTTWNNIANTGNTFTYNNLAATIAYRAYVQNTVCPALYSNTVTINVVQPVTIANAGPDQLLCNVTATTLAANTPASGTGIWTALAGNPSTATFTNPNDPATTVNALTAGTYQFIWTISNALCADSKDTVRITVYSPSVAGTLAAAATVCANVNTGTLTLSGYVSSIIRWESSSNNGTTWNNIANTGNTFTYNNLAATITYRAYVQNTVCPALYSNTVTINTVQPVTIANAGPDQLLCNVTAITLAANTPASGTGIWTAITGNPSTVNFTNPADPNTTVNGLTAGTYQFIWTISNALCADSKDTVRITVYSPSVAGTLAAAATVCANVNTGTLTLSGYVSSIIRWESSSNNGTTWNNIANTGNTFTYNNLAATIAYRAYVQNTVCPALYSNTVTINVVQPVTIANAGPDQLLCNVTATTLAANTPASGTGIWTAITGNPSTATFTNPNDPATTVNALTAGTYQFIWTISNALCADSKDTVRIIVYPPTIAGTLAAAATVCAAANTGTLTLSGNNGNIIHWESSSDNGTTWNNIAGTGNTFIYNNLTTATLFRVLIQNGVCATSYTNIVLVIVLQPSSIANAGNNQVLCNSSAAKLNATIPSSGAGVWAQVSGPTGAVFTNKQLPGTTVSGLTTGTYQFIWIIANGICPISTSTTTIKIDPPTFAGTLVNDNTVCTGTNTGTLTLSGFTGNIIRWETSTDSGASWTSITDTTVSSVYNNLTATTQYRVLVQSGVCTAMYSNMVTVTVNPASVPGKLSADAIVCATDNTGTLNLGSHTGNITRWEFSTDKGSTWTSINNTTDTYTYSNLGNTTRYRVMVQSGICSAAYSDIAVITVDPATVAGVLTGSAIVCFGRNGGNLTLTGKTGNVIHWESSSDKGITWYIIADTLTTYTYTNLTSTTQYRVLVKNGSCGLQYSNIITITVLEPATIANAGPDQVLCNANTSTILNGNIPASGVGKWRFISGPSAVTFADNSLPNAIVSGLQIGTYRFEWAISNGVCANSTSTVTVKVDQVKAWFNLTSMAICGKSTYQFIDKSLSGFGIDNWKWSINPGDTIPTKNYTIDFTEAGSYTVTLTAQSITGCTGTAQATFPVTIYQFPEVNINSIADACRSQLFQLSPVVNSRDSIAYLLWNMANGLKSKDSVVTVQYTNTGNYTIKLTVSTVNHCLDSAYKKITIHSAPVLTVNNSATICKGDSIQLQANGAMSYIWTDQYNNVICNNCSSPKVKPINNIQFKVIGYNEYGCSDIKTTNVNVIQPLKMLASSGDTICAGTTKQLFAAGAVNYSWYPETGLSSKTSARPFANPLATTTYRVVGKDNFNCFSDTAEVRIVVGHPTPIRLGKDTIIMAGQPYQLNVTAATGDIRKWHWNGSQGLSCLNCPTPQLRVSDDVCISCLAVNIYGCVSTDTVCIKTFCPSTQLFVPNAFTPDGDGINDVLLVQGSGIKMIKSLRIFNRWGEMVFQKTNFLPGDPAYAWDGKIRGNAAPPDVFVYMCEVICEKGLPSIFKGNTAILK